MAATFSFVYGYTVCRHTVLVDKPQSGAGRLEHNKTPDWKCDGKWDCAARCLGIVGPCCSH